MVFCLACATLFFLLVLATARHFDQIFVFLLVLANVAYLYENGLCCLAGAKKNKLVQYSLLSFFFKLL